MEMNPVAYCYYAPAAIAYLRSNHARQDSEMLLAFIYALDFHVEYNPFRLHPIKRRLENFLWYVHFNWEKFWTWQKEDDQETGLLIESIRDRLRMISNQAALGTHSTA